MLIICQYLMVRDIIITRVNNIQCDKMYNKIKENNNTSTNYIVSVKICSYSLDNYLM